MSTVQRPLMIVLLIAIFLFGIFMKVTLLLTMLELFRFSFQTAQDIHTEECEDLPTLNEVQNRVEANHQAITKIEELNGWLTVDSERCPGKADVIIYYSSITQRAQIRKMLGKTFFGVPYQMRNV